MNDKPEHRAADARPDDISHPHKTPSVREAHDAEDKPDLARDPEDEDSKLDVGLDESFPSSDPPASTQPGHGRKEHPQDR